jgi:hypothetical protein
MAKPPSGNTHQRELRTAGSATGAGFSTSQIWACGIIYSITKEIDDENAGGV